MARLLLWIADRGDDIDSHRWSQLAGRIKAGLPDIRDADCFQWRAPGCAALAIRTRSRDPVPIRVALDGRVAVSDARDSMSREILETPPDEPGAHVLVDPASRHISLLRDRLGQRPLAYARLKNGWLIASREEALLAHPDVDSALDDTFLVTHFALVDPLPSCALYLGTRQVEHGTRIDIKGSAVRIRRLEYNPDDDVARLSDVDAARRFREILEASVADCCRGAGRLGMQLSAGLDSSAVAALLPEAFRTRGTLAVNYGTNLDHGIDERPLAAKLAARLGLSLVSLDTADYPASLDVGNDHDPSYPYVNPYRPLKRAVHETFARAGCDVVLTGDFGDHWEAPAHTWLLDALAHRRMDVVASSLAWIARKRGALAIWHDVGVRHALGRLVGRKERPAEYRWLRPRWRDLARTQSLEARERFRHWPLPAHTAYNLGSLTALDAAYERHYLEPRALDMRYPWRNWTLLRFALSLPAYQSSRNGTGKWLARRALAGVLPPEWVDRPKMGDLRPLLDRLVEPGERREQFIALIERGRPIWERFVEPVVVQRSLEALEGNSLRDGLLVELASFSAWYSNVHPHTLAEPA